MKSCQASQTKAIWVNPHHTHPAKCHIVSITVTLRKSGLVQKEAFKNYLFEVFTVQCSTALSFLLPFLDGEPLPACQPSRLALHYQWITEWNRERAKFSEVLLTILHERHDLDTWFTWPELKELQSTTLVHRKYSSICTINQVISPGFLDASLII